MFYAITDAARRFILMYSNWGQVILPRQNKRQLAITDQCQPFASFAMHRIDFVLAGQFFTDILWQVLDRDLFDINHAILGCLICLCHVIPRA